MNDNYAVTADTRPEQSPAISASAREFDLLLACARTVPDARRIAAIVNAGIDWRAFTTLAGQHGLRPLVFRSLKAHCWESLPADIQAEWQQTVRLLAIRTLFMVGEVLRITGEFSQAGIPVAVLKGAVIAEIAYGDMSLREFNDIDLLVQPSHLASAVELIERLDYQPSWKYDIGTVARFLRNMGEYKLSNYDHHTDIDLHWRVADKAVALSPALGDFPSGFQPVRIAGSSVLSLAFTELPLYLAAQGGRDQWGDLRRICDLAEFLRRYPELDWRTSFDTARRLGGLRSMLIGLWLASRLFDAPLPVAAVQLIEADAAVARLAERGILRLRQSRDPDEPISRYLFQLRTKQGLSGKLALVWSILTDRTDKDGSWLMLPRPLWWLYSILRPIRIGMKALRRA